MTLGLTVTIRRVADGVERTFADTWGIDDDDFGGAEQCYWHWTDGNYGCDCNRELFFARAGGEDDGGGIHPCGSGRYVARVVTSSGEVIIDEISK